MKRLVIVALLLSTLCASAAWRSPHGIIQMAGTGAGSSYGTNAAVNGAHINLFWADINPSEGTFDWTAADAKVTANNGFTNKQIIFAPRFLVSAPAWLTSKPGVVSYTITAGGDVIVLPWDPVVQPYLLAAIAAFCQHFDGQIDGVEMGGIGWDIETYFPIPTDTSPNIPLTLTDEVTAWTASSKLVIDTYAANLHQCPFIMAAGNTFGGATGQNAITDVFSYAQKYGVHFGVMQWGLNPNSNTSFFVNDWINRYSFKQPAAFQLTGSTQGGGAGLTSLQLALIAGANLKAQFIEVYASDCDTAYFLGLLRFWPGQLAPPPPSQHNKQSLRIAGLRRRM